MDFQTVLFVFGAILFVVGLIGQIKAKELEVGSTSKVVRVLCFIIGIFFIFLSLVYPFHQTSEEETTNTSVNENLSQPTEEPVTPIMESNATADATFTYWEKCKLYDRYYGKLLTKQDSILQDSTLSNKMMGEKYVKKADLIRLCLRREEDIDAVGVDPELMELFRQLRVLLNQRANNFKTIGDLYLKIGYSPDDATINSATNGLIIIRVVDSALSLKFDLIDIERGILKEKLSRKYNRKFIDHDE